MITLNYSKIQEHILPDLKTNDKKALTRGFMFMTTAASFVLHAFTFIHSINES